MFTNAPKHWSRIMLAVVYGVAAIIATITFITTSTTLEYLADTNGWSGVYFYVATFIAVMIDLLGMTVVMTLKACSTKRAVSLAYVITGGIVTIMEIVTIILMFNYNPKFVTIVGNKGVGGVDADAFRNFMMVYAVLFLYGLYPLIKGVTRLVEAEHQPMPAKTAPAVAPAPVEAKAAPADTTAPAAVKTPAAKKATTAKKTTK